MKLSIVIPASGSQTEIDDTLVSVLENRPADCEIVLSHPVDYQDPYQLDDEVRLIECSRADSASLWNAGMMAAQGQIVHALSPGMIVHADWCEHAVHAFDQDASVGAVAPTLICPQQRRLIRGIDYHVGAGKRVVHHKRQTVLAPLLGTGFYLRRALHFMHGFDARFQVWADVELGLRMHSANYRCVADQHAQLRASSPLTLSMDGYRAGQIRGNLFLRARDLGVSKSQRLALLTELFRNGWGLGMLTGLAGRFLCSQLEPLRDQTAVSPTEGTERRGLDQRQAA